jgi:hypothetical protein
VTKHDGAEVESIFIDETKVGQALRQVWSGDADPRAGLEADPLADRVDAADNLMSRHNRQLGVWQFAIDDVEVGAADTASLDPNANLARSGRWLGPLSITSRSCV